MTNMNLNRSYTANNVNSIFASNTPYISDAATGSYTYTISFSTDLGTFERPGVTPSSTISVSGTKDYCNSLFANIKFYPTPGVSSNGTFTYIQLKDGVEQVNQSVSLIGTAANYAGARSLSFNTSQNWTPDYQDILYGKISSVLVAGGGGGGAGGCISQCTGG